MRGEICFILSYSKIIEPAVLLLFKINLVVHASDLPTGRGWSPASWAILEGCSRIPVTLIEASEKVDEGDIFDQVWLEIESHDLIEDWRKKIADATLGLARRFINDYPSNLGHRRTQVGVPSYYKKRSPKDSRLSPKATILDQFNLLRVVDNDSYPAFFTIESQDYELKISKRGN